MRPTPIPTLHAGLLLALALFSAPAAAELRAWLDRDQVYTGDSITLTIQADGANRSGQPELSVLASDFDVLGSSRGSEIRIINGRHSANTNWRISLSPKRAGRLRIPPISVGDETTRTLELDVQEVPEGALGGAGDDVFVELELGAPPDQVVVQQQVPIAVRLYSARNLINGGLGEPRAEGAVLERLGEDRRYRTSRNGREYQVIERRYSLSPEHSGELRIPPVVFEGEIEADDAAMGARSRSGSPFDDPMFDRMFDDSLFRRGFSMFDHGQPVRAQSEALTLQVAASPEAFAGGPWLPAESLSISDDWASNPPRLRLGEPATRTLTLTARGLSGSQMPAIEMPVPDGVRRYAETPESESRTDGETLYGVSRQAFTLIPTRGGELILPGFEVRWWDTVEQRERIERVSERRLQVAGAAASVPEPAPAGPPDRPNVEAEAAQVPANPSAPASVPVAASAAQPQDPARRLTWAWLAAAIGAVLALVGTGFWWRSRRRAGTKPQVVPELPRLSGLRVALRQACLADDPRATAKALLAWAQARHPEAPPVNLAEVARQLPDAVGPIRGLEQALYAADAGGWHGAALWRAVTAAGDRPQGDADTPADGLRPLYPHRVA